MGQVVKDQRNTVEKYRWEIRQWMSQQIRIREIRAMHVWANEWGDEGSEVFEVNNNLHLPFLCTDLQCQLWAFVGKVNSKFILILIRGLCCQPWEFVIDFNRFVLSSITDELKREKLGGEMGVAPAVHLLIGREKNANRAHTWSYVQRMGTHLHKSIFPNLIVRLLSLSYHISLHGQFCVSSILPLHPDIDWKRIEHHLHLMFWGWEQLLCFHTRAYTHVNWIHLKIHKTFDMFE